MIPSIHLPDLWLALYDGFFLLFGLSMNMALVLAEMSAKTGAIVWPWTFIKARPWKSYLMFCGAVVGYFMIKAYDPSPPEILLIACGWSANDMLDRLGTVTAHMKLP